ncbi:hypothetical protein EBZ39_06940 [bacterium]|nr:hypothetical protein [bacterium]
MSDIVVTTIAGPSNINVAVGTPIANTAAGVTPHASSHATGGSDPVSPGSIGALSTGEGIAYAIALG